MMSKRYPFALSVLLALTLLVGCAAKSTTPTPLPTGAINQTDASTYRVLNDAHAFLQSIRDSVTAGNLTLTAAQKATFNALVVSSNAADATWKAYHSGQSTDATKLAAQVNKLNADMSAAQSQIIIPAVRP